MPGYYRHDLFELSSACPFSCALVQYALRVGGAIDPAFLAQCEIMDPKFKKSVDALKAVPLVFDSSTAFEGYEEDIFLDIASPKGEQFYDSWSFKEFNSWIGTDDQFHSPYYRDGQNQFDLF